LYFSGGYDWSYLSPPQFTLATDELSFYLSAPDNAEYAAYVWAHYKEIIDKYEPSVIWNDFSIPAAFNILELFAYYYNNVQDVVVNDRWSALSPPYYGEGHPNGTHFDFATVELNFVPFETALPYKWECDTSVSFSFAYNQAELPTSFMTGDEIVDLFVDVVSKNGNLLINVGPFANGSIEESQLGPLREFGKWVHINGVAMFGSKPWTVAQGQTNQLPEGRVRFTSSDSGKSLYVSLLDTEFPDCALTNEVKGKDDVFCTFNIINTQAAPDGFLTQVSLLGAEEFPIIPLFINPAVSASKTWELQLLVPKIALAKISSDAWVFAVHPAPIYSA